MRLHRNLVFAVIDALNLIFNEGEYADKVVAKILKRDKRWGARDRAFIAETVYDCVRWRRLYNEIAQTKNHFTNENLWKIFAVWATLKGIPLPDWKHFENTPIRRIKGRFDSLQDIRAIKESIPDWLDKLGEKELGKQWQKELHALNQQAKVVLRVNTLKITPQKLQDLLCEEDISTIFLPEYPDALQLTERKNVFATKGFKNGLFEVQDASSQLVAPFLNAKPGMRIIDACAGAGGKSLHLAALMKNKGQIIALDIYDNKLKELKRRAKRNGAFNIETRTITGTKTIKKLYHSADRVLIDAPCSGLGVLKRNPDAKWKLTPEFITEAQRIQTEILTNYAKMVKPEGELTYATCSILPSENQQQVKNFLTANKPFRLIDEKIVLPSVSGYDGFYMARLQKIQ
ncbi:MAG: RNA methyltransferase [Flavobacteriales bacterium]|nr:MAG: RNA methyltransferase [Flavobacteriales bacterium]